MLADKYFVNTTLYSSSAGRYLYTVPLIWDNIIRHTFFKDIASEDRTEVTSRFVQDENVLEFKSLSLSYSFPQKWIKKMYMERMKLTFQMEDIFRISTVKRERGLDYPFARTFNFGLQVQF